MTAERLPSPAEARTEATEHAGMTDAQGFLDFDSAHLDRYIDAFARQHVVCVGDLMLDSFVYGEARRISPEAPISMRPSRWSLSRIPGH